MSNPSGSASGGSSPNESLLVGARYNATPPTLTDGQQAALQLDSAGRLIVAADLVPGGTQDVNLTKVAGATVATGHGTAAGAIRVELPTDGTGVVGLAAGTAVIGHVINDAGSAVIGKVGIDQTTPGTTNLVQTPTPAAVTAGQYKITASAVSIGSQALVNGVVLKAKNTNVGAIWVGPTGVTTTDDGTGNGFRLNPGDTLSLAVANVSAIFAIGTANDVLYWTGN